MNYWFQDPGIKGLLPLATATAIKGLTTFFNVPTLVMGSNALPEGGVIGPSALDIMKAQLNVMSKGSPAMRALIVTDAFADRFAQKVARILEQGGFSTMIWNKALPEVPLDNVRECANEMNGYAPDTIVAVGGGSVIDGAKAAWILYERPDITDLFGVNPLELLGLRKKAMMVAIPTTSGTGSECTPVTVVHDVETHRKVPIASGDLAPDMAILIPGFTMSMPPGLTVGTGLDVFAHAVDGLMTPAANELTDAMNLGAIKLVAKFLPRAFKNGKDREARHRMLVASAMAGIGFGQNSACLTHSLGHALGSLFNIHHGLAVGFFVPFALQYYRATTDKALEIADALKIRYASPDEGFTALLDFTRNLYRELDVPLSLKEMNLDEGEFNRHMEEMVLFACEDIDTFFSPRPITPAECERLFRCAWEGRDVDF